MAEPSEQMRALAGKLGMTDKQLEALRKQRGSDDKTMRWLRRTYEQTRDRPRLLGKTGGYTERPGYALQIRHETDQGTEGEPEAVDALTQKRLTREARAREQDAAVELILAVEDVRQAIRERIEQNPAFRGRVGRSLYRLTAELDRMQKNAKRRAA